VSELDRFIEYVRTMWDDHGACGSCGRHAALYEHGPFDESDLPEPSDIAEGYVRWSCQNDDDEYRHRHRGVRIPLHGWKPGGEAHHVEASPNE